ncbi:hypothetical protein SAY87_020763 [Trapa incisa]|uniref:Trichome birefringence-like N-terminal domain-containing protein n=1 Tax=Trapa incisa TaxID=236973 RepID=A0AAN7JQ99_9MYRT|nr:hypothetical protein SAY87_020763 [Trapa incisa]
MESEESEMIDRPIWRKWKSFAQFRSPWKRFFSFLHQRIKGLHKLSILSSFNGVVALGSSMSFLLAITLAYLLVLPRFQSQTQIHRTYEVQNSSGSPNECNLFEGGWIRDESYPIYNASGCPFSEQGFDCLSNGRKDRGFMKWRWKPKHCDIPQFNAHRILEYLRGKRVVFVGDSLSRTQWESFICMLMTGVQDKRSVYEANGKKITKQIRFLSVVFSSYNFRVDFYRSVFLVQPGPVPKRAPKRVKTTITLDKLDDISNEWIDSDALIFNSGHWWNPTKLFEMGWYFQQGGSLKLGMPISSAFRTALETWASWVENNIDTNRTSVFFRTFESSHWSGRSRSSCKVTRHPSTRTNKRDRSSISDAILKVVKRMVVPVTALHVTLMGAYRSDAHVGTWSDNPSVPDCSHWCLPGVPDSWNEVLFSYLIGKNRAYGP